MRRDHLQLRQAATDLPHINTETQRSENNNEMHIYSQVSRFKKDRAVELKRAPPPVQSYKKHSQIAKQHESKLECMSIWHKRCIEHIDFHLLVLETYQVNSHHSEEIKVFLNKADEMHLEGKAAFEHEFKVFCSNKTCIHTYVHTNIIDYIYIYILYYIGCIYVI